MSLVGKPCPKFEKGQLEWLKGDPTDLPVPGKACVIELWATWCGPCRQVFPHLSKIQETHKDTLAVVGVSMEEAGPQLAQFVSQQGDKMAYTVAASDRVGGALMQAAGVSGIPHSFVVASDGTICFSGHPSDHSFAEAVDLVTKQSVPQSEALPLVTASRDELSAMPVRQLKALLSERGLSFAGLAEKQDIVDKVLSDCTKQTFFKKPS